MKHAYKLCLFFHVVVCVASLRADIVQGWTRSNASPIPALRVTLYRAGTTQGSGETVLGSVVSDSNGFFRISYPRLADANAVAYLIADRPGEATRLAAMLGTAPVPTNVTINERTTVATAYAMAQFIVETSVGGKSPGLQNAAGMYRNLVNPATGAVGAMLGSFPNGTHTSTMKAFNSLANMIAGALVSPTIAGALFDAATPPGGPRPDDTLQAAVNIAHNPWQNSEALFGDSQFFAPYQPDLELPPVAWTLAIKFIGNGREFDGPGAMSFDAQGNVWVTNNYVFRRNHSVPTCGGMEVLKLTPTGQDAPGAPFDGRHAGVNGPGFGITIDPTGNVWIGNFGFFGNTCPDNLRPPANSISKFRPNGTPLSPRGGFTSGCISSPQGTVSDRAGNIWIANTCNGTVTQYRAGNPNHHWVFDIQAGTLIEPGQCPSSSAAKPFDIAIDADGNAWVTNNTQNNAFKLSPAGALLATSGPEAEIFRPLGIAIDSLGNIWVSNTGVLEVPCATSGDNQDYGSLEGNPLASVAKLAANGALLGTFRGGGIQLPWGIAIDGNDNVWVAEFGGRSVTHLSGATGEPIAPNGYPSDALDRNTGISIDPSGNVWLCNNWLIDPVQTNPGGDGLVVFIGIAGPVKTPLLGPPRQP